MPFVHSAPETSPLGSCSNPGEPMSTAIQRKRTSQHPLVGGSVRLVTSSSASFSAFQSWHNINYTLNMIIIWALNYTVILTKLFHVSVHKLLLWLQMETATLLRPFLSRWEGKLYILAERKLPNCPAIKKNKK